MSISKLQASITREPSPIFENLEAYPYLAHDEITHSTESRFGESCMSLVNPKFHKRSVSLIGNSKEPKSHFRLPKFVADKYGKSG